MTSLLDLLRYFYRRPQHIIIHFFSNFFSKKLEIDEMDNVLIISPHPDDEVFGCANLIYALSYKCKKLNIIYLSKGEASISTDKCNRQELVDARKNLAIHANSLLGVDRRNLYFLNFPDGHFSDATIEQIEMCKHLIEQIKPQYIFYPHPYDGSPDHKVATIDIQKIVQEKNIIQYYYCVWLWYHMPLYKAFLLNYCNSYILGGDSFLKAKVVDIYTSALSKCGDPYSGKLPKMFLKAIHWDKELYFKKK